MHCAQKMTHNIYWIGSNDWTTERFENLFPYSKWWLGFITAISIDDEKKTCVGRLCGREFTKNTSDNL